MASWHVSEKDDSVKSISPAMIISRRMTTGMANLYNYICTCTFAQYISNMYMDYLTYLYQKCIDLVNSISVTNCIDVMSNLNTAMTNILTQVIPFQP